MQRLSALRQELDARALFEASAALFPMFVLYQVSGNPLWLRASIVTLCTYIASARSGLAPIGVLLHGGAIALGLLLLVSVSSASVAFVLNCTLLAIACLYLATIDAGYRSLGNFTFIPVVYLACESIESASDITGLVAQTLAFLPYIAAALIPVLVINNTAKAREPRRHYLLTIVRSDRLKRSPLNRAAMITIACSVSLAAGLTRWYDIHNAQWVIWSAASVVTGDAASSRLKLRERFVGASIGVPLGIVLGLIVPRTHFSYQAATLLSMLTLVMFHRYLVGFTARCCFIACALLIAGNAPGIAFERTENVILGGLIGIIFVTLVNFLKQFFMSAVWRR